jgi:hypothetical protein
LLPHNSLEHGAASRWLAPRLYAGLLALSLLAFSPIAMADELPASATVAGSKAPLKVPITKGCREVGVITSDAEAAYQPGIDADGQPVVPADLSAESPEADYNQNQQDNPSRRQPNPSLPDKVRVNIKAPFPQSQLVPGTDPEISVTTVDVDIRPQNPTTVICPEGMEPIPRSSKNPH